MRKLPFVFLNTAAFLFFALLAACGDDGTALTDAGMDTGLRPDVPGEDVSIDTAPDVPAVDCSGRPADAPVTRGEVAGILDEAKGRILIYGGNAAAPIMCRPMFDIVDELWAFHLDCNSWEQLELGGGPGLRARHEALFDAASNRMLIFGGRNRLASGAYENFNDVWAFDLTTDTWSELTTTGTPPPARSTSAVGIDETKNRLVVFGGNASTSGLEFIPLGDTFALDLTTLTWSEIAGDAPPSRLLVGSTVLDNELVIFGGTTGFTAGFLNDTWAFNFENDTWRMVAGGGPASPLTRFGPELMTDAAQGRVVMVGGHDSTDLGNRNDTWAVTVAGVWTEVHAGDTLNGMANGPCMFPEDFTIADETSPERRYSFARMQSATTGYVFGGKTDCGNINDVWSIDFATGAWEQLRPPTSGESCNRSGTVGCTTLCF